MPEIVVFDDVFVAENVYSGIDVDPEHRQNLHDLILGAQGVALSKTVQMHVAQIEDHNRTLRAKADAVAVDARGRLSVDDFCALRERTDIDREIQDAERTLAAARAENAIRTQPLFDKLAIPDFPVASIEELLQRDLSDLDTEAVSRVQSHITKVGRNGERWIGEGLPRVAPASIGKDEEICPFCVQSLSGSPLIGLYRAYFSESYGNLKQSVEKAVTWVHTTHSGDVPAAFERSIRVAIERRQFWSRFIGVPEIVIDTAAVSRAWNAATEAVVGALQAKQAAPLEKLTLSAEMQATLDSYRQRFNAGFSLKRVNSVNTRGGSACTYHMLINSVEVPIAPGSDTDPCFRTTMSAGDRNTLALAFFFASLDRDPQRSAKVVLIDDPMTSLDEHRSLTTIQEMRRLAVAVDQLIVLSHSKPFLCALWEGAEKNKRTAIKIVRDGTGSTLGTWDVREDSITQHDRNHALLRGYIQTSGSADERAVASALGPILECFTRVAYAEHFPPGTLLGHFLGVCRQKENTPEQALSASDANELRDLLDYANKFHHDTNPAWETATINDSELNHFCQRTLRFTRHPMATTVATTP